MRQSITFLAFLASTAIAQDVVTFFFPGGSEGVDPVATIVTANPSTTEMMLACPTGVDSNDCGWGIGMDVKIISGTSYELTASFESSTAGYNCQHNTKAAEMTCTGFGSEGGPQTAVFSQSDVDFVSATVVEGAELLSATGSANASANSASASANSASATSSGLKTSASTMASGSAAASSQASGSAAPSSHASHSGATPTSSGSVVPTQTGAAAKLGMEGSAILALAGVVALYLW